MEELLIPADADEAREPGRPGTADSVKEALQSACGASVRTYLKQYVKRNGLLTLSVLGVGTGCVLGYMLRGLEMSTQAKMYFSFPGELLMRMLKMLILPLITSSLMSGLSSMESKACCRMGVLTVTYYLWTTFIAVVVGIVLVLIIKPGYGTEMEMNRLGGGPVMTSADALLDLVRNMIPSNLIEATFQQYKTDLIPVLKTQVTTKQPSFLYLMPDEENPKGRTVLLELTPPPDMHYKTIPGSSQQMNVLGIVIFSATMGLLLGKMGERGAPLVNVCQCINECVMKIINAAVWYFPFGIIFLVAGKILDMDDPSTLGRKLGWYTVTVLGGLFIHGLILLPFFYFLLTRKNPFSYIRGLLQAMVIALATSSSSATLPITMKCLLENCHVDRQIARFVLPVGATINMDGTALYEAVAAIFIAQVNEYELDFGQLVTISITATAASIGAAGIPQAGLVTMVIVLTSVGLPPDDITLIVAIDWILRCSGSRNHCSFVSERLSS
ncbi:excitatory amino acid transporter 5 isoform X2 [Pygocentrus nattereri]|uniref:excitatory amino acid transporter 5 isoform X2 n=1 Tax=Pygocentrus nattereri TaxID=42514 RepID=UPI001891D5EB|nr:excitatory amino acid transporter 5 isoform X2 [Pygocentrus nattereri]